MAKERILITVRTYPTLSQKYVETVCTGGITDEGEWRRLHPVALRYLGQDQQYRTYDTIEVDVKDGKDGRPETRRPHLPSLKITGHLKSWSARCGWVNPTIVPSLAAMQAASRTLAPVVVREVLEFSTLPCATDWTAKQKEQLRQAELFDERHPLENIPFEFRFRWIDGDRAEHNSLVLAWEVGETWRQYRRTYPDPIKVMREKWLADLCGPSRQVSFFMGNLARFHSVYTICGVFGPPMETQQDATLW